MSFLPAALEPVRPAFLTRVTPVSRLVGGVVWLGAVLLSVDPVVPAALLAAGLVALVFLSGLPLGRLPARMAPLLVAAVGLAVITILVHPSGGDPTARELFRIGPLRLTEPGVSAGLALALRLAVIAVTSVLVFAPSDPTRLADSLVQQWRLPDRVAYGTLAALRIAPQLAVDWSATGAVRRLRGLESRTPLGRVRVAAGRLMTLLVSSVRRAGRMALAMDARGFDSDRPRSRFRPIAFGEWDWAVIGGAIVTAALALILGRIL